MAAGIPLPAAGPAMSSLLVVQIEAVRRLYHLSRQLPLSRLAARLYQVQINSKA